jgi:hypothetical protein
MYLYLKCNVKGGTWNTNFKVMNQHKNNMCHVQSSKKDFYLGAPSSFDRVFTLLCWPQFQPLYSNFVVFFILQQIPSF